MATNSYNLIAGNYPIWNRPGETHPAAWSFTNLGSVFGLTMDRSRNIYVTASSMTPPTVTVSGTTGSTLITYNYQSNIGTLGLNGQPLSAATATIASGTIYKLDATTGAATVFAQLPQQQITINYATAFSDFPSLLLTDGTRTLGPGLGNIDFDDWHDQFFVTNMEDGKIYRISSAGTTLSTFDFGTLDNGAVGMPALGERLYAVAFYNGRVYYSIWNNVTCPAGNCGNTGSNPYAFANSNKPLIRSVALDPTTGDFLPATDQLEWNGSDLLWGSAISDIDFNPEGQMVISQRTILREFSSYNHRSQVAILTGSSGSWTADVFMTGPAESPTNANRYGTEAYGGSDFGYFGSVPDSTVWYSSADMIRDGNIANGSQGPHGFAGTSIGSIAAGDFPDPRAVVPYDAAVTNPTSVDSKGSGGELDIMDDCMSLGSLVWRDVNDNGLVDMGEPGVPNVKVYLLASNGVTIIDSTITDVNGEILFSSLFAGDYMLELIPPAGFSSSTGSGFAMSTGTFEPAPDPDLMDTDSDDNGTIVGLRIRSAVISLREIKEPTGDGSLTDLIDITANNNANYAVDFGLLACGITDITFSNQSTCNDNGTPSNTADDWFTADLTVDFVMAPGTGTLDLSGDVQSGGGATSVAVGALGSATSYTFIGVRLDADGTASQITATFSADPTCTFSITNGPSVNNCSVPVGTFDLALTKALTSASTPLMVGDQVVFTLTVINQGTLNATNVSITDFIPTGLTLNDPNWTAVGNQATLNTPIPTVPAMSQISIDITFIINNQASGSISNSAEISGASGGVDNDSNPGNGTVGSSEDDFSLAAFFVCVLPELNTQNEISICKGSILDLASLVISHTGDDLEFYSTLSDAQNDTNAFSSSTVTPLVATNYFVKSVFNPEQTGCETIEKVTVFLRSANCVGISVSGPGN